jgi:aspartokinase
VDAKGLAYNPDVAVISVFGPHLREKPRIPGMMFTALASVGVGPLAIANSISSVSCVVEGQYLDTAVDSLNEVFDAPFQVKKRPKEY